MKTRFALPLLATLLLLGGCSNGARNDLKDHQAADRKSTRLNSSH